MRLVLEEQVLMILASKDSHVMTDDRRAAYDKVSKENIQHINYQGR